jgi:hypothetical protein
MSIEILVRPAEDSDNTDNSRPKVSFRKIADFGIEVSLDVPYRRILIASDDWAAIRAAFA